MLLYSLLHLAGVRKVDADGKVLDEPSPSRSTTSRTSANGAAARPATPRSGHTTGVETTTGPLGQGCGNSVGMAIAGRWLAARYNQPGFELFDYNVYTQCSDGDLMEGVSCEAASLAGHLKLSNLCWIYDDNHITIEGKTDLAFSEDVATRFRGLGWHVLEVAGRQRPGRDRRRLSTASSSHDGSPTLIVVKSIIGYGAPKKANTAEAHGEAARRRRNRQDESRLRLARRRQVPRPARSARALSPTRSASAAQNSTASWEKLFAEYEKKHPELAARIRA